MSSTAPGASESTIKREVPDIIFHAVPHGITADQMHEMQWTKPQLVAQIRFTEWTAENRLRHAAFLGLRLDKPADMA
jgi:bifunctional non-homologous end joining protein LigD